MTISCPCCGYNTINKRGVFEICLVCWWEDDGEDNINFKQFASGCNAVDLATARRNFINHGIYDPSRRDLIKHSEPANKYLKIREFKYDSKTDIILEIGSEWHYDFSK